MNTYALKQFLIKFDATRFIVIAALLIIFTTVFVFPLGTLFVKAFTDGSGVFTGLANYRAYFGNPALSASILNTINISLVTTIVSTILGFVYAYAIMRTNIRFKSLFKYLALLPIFLPTVVHALGLVYIFGRQGIITRLGIDIGLYGHNGIIISEIIYTFPSAFLLFMVAMEFVDGRLYEACDSMGVKPIKQFFSVTLPEMKYTIVNTVFVCFTLAFTDFGAPKVIGGSYNVLATDIYKQIAGQFNMNMGAVVGTLLLIPAVLSFITGRFINNKNSSALNAKTIPLKIKPNAPRDIIFFVICSLVSLSFLFLVASLVIGAFTTYYPYDFNFTFKHFIFNQSSGGIDSFINSVVMSILTAIFGTIFVFLFAYSLEKTKGLGILTKYGKLLSVLPLAVPGMVVGISYIFFFNSPSNPFNFIYGTMIILVLANVIHYFSVPYLTATGALKKLDSEFEVVSESMKVPTWKTFVNVSVPLSIHAIAEIALYFFVNSMVTVSALVFLYSADFKIASIAITHMEEAGNISQAAAMSLLILFINIIVRIIYEYLVRMNNHKKHLKGSEK